MFQESQRDGYEGGEEKNGKLMSPPQIAGKFAEIE